MREILDHAILQSLILDLGSGRGSFAKNATRGKVIRVEKQRTQVDKRELFVQSDAAQLPFADSTFTAIIANHSLEHMDGLDRCLAELGRVVRKDGALFISVPDASTFTDRLYRWLAKRGGHVNPFTCAPDLAAKIEAATGLPHMGTKILCSSLSFLNSRNSPKPIPRKLRLLGSGSEWSLFLYSWFSRRLDRLTGSRTSVYGWGTYFGHFESKVETKAWLNVCIRCGRGRESSTAIKERGFFGQETYCCGGCGARNPFARDFDIQVGAERE